MTFHPTNGYPLSQIPRGYAEERPTAIAVRTGQRTCTWQELEQDSTVMAHRLKGSGVALGDIISILMKDAIDILTTAFACYKVGATPQVLSPKIAAAELHAILELSNPPVVVVHDDSLFADHADLPVVTAAQLRTPLHTEHTLPEGVSPSWKAPTSGGSTGRPKIILSATPAELSEFDAEIWGIERHEQLLMTAPLHHNAPFSTSLTALVLGGEVTVLEWFDPEAVLKNIQEHKSTWAYLVPTMMRRISALPNATRSAYDLSSLRALWHCAEPCPTWLKREWIDWIGAERLQELYAGTEAHAGCTINGQEWLAHPGSIGKPTWGEMKILDDEHQEITQPCVVGEIFMRLSAETPTGFRYLGATLDELEGGWSTLGDMGEFDSEGYIYLCDRRSDMITVGGVNVYPAEVEAVLTEHPRVLSAAVIGLPDEKAGNRIHAVIQVEKGQHADSAEILDFASVGLSRHKLPTTFEIVRHALRDDAGKVRRSTIRMERLGS